MNSGSDENFLARWSRRKRAGEPETDADAKLDRSGSAPGAKPAATVEPPFDVSKLPSIADLTESSDIAQFLQKGVPDELKRLALRRAWSLDPAIRDFVEVAENQYDWNVVGGVPGFGELDAGTDLKALLMQATGQLPEVDDKVATAATVAPRDHVATVVAPQRYDLAASPAATGDNLAVAAGPTATDVALQNENHPVAPPSEMRDVMPVTAAPVASRRRRHGGALAGIFETDVCPDRG